MLIGRNIKRIGNCVNATTPLEFECLIDGYKWKTSSSNVIDRGTGCPKCNKCSKLTNEILDERLKSKNVVTFSEYKSLKHEMQFQCKICNHIWANKPNDMLSIRGCPKCYKVIWITNEIVDERLLLENIPIKRIGEYESSLKKLKFQCIICNHTWDSLFNNILKAGHRCTNCSVSLRQEKLTKHLIEKYIKYDVLEYQKKIYIDNKRRYPDFYLEIGNNKIIIEYNGRQHYMPVKFGGISLDEALKNFEQQKIRDNLLKDYCKINGIHFFEIPYTLNNVQMEDFIKNINKIFNL
jgi:hypothetical protein